MRVVTIARKPLEGAVAEAVIKNGAGALNIDGCRVEGPMPHTVGRWPANMVLQGKDVVAEIGRQSGWQKDGVAGGKSHGFRTAYVGGTAARTRETRETYGGQGTAARFFMVVVFLSLKLADW